MVRKGNKKAKAKAPRKRRVVKKKSGAKNRSNAPMGSYMNLVVDPCNGPLVRAVGSDNGTGIMERFRFTTQVPSVRSGGIVNTAGYLAWFPSFHNSGGGNYEAGNLYLHEVTNGELSTPPLNDTSVCMGGGIENYAGVFLQDPAYSSLNVGATFSRARTIAACMQLETLQELSTIKGQVVTVVQMSLQTFFGAGSAGRPPSVSQLLAYGAKRERLNIDGHEVVWAPGERDSILRGTGQDLAGNSAALTQNAAFWMGANDSDATIVSTPDPSTAMCVILVWNGVTTPGVLQLNCVKVCEMELAPRANTIEPPIVPRPIRSKATLATVVDALDRSMPSWRAHAARYASAGLSRLTGYVLGGAPYMASVGRQALRGQTNLALMDGEL